MHSGVRSARSATMSNYRNMRRLKRSTEGWTRQNGIIALDKIPANVNNKTSAPRESCERKLRGKQ